MSGEPSISILLLDDHTVMRAGVSAIVAAEPDLELAGAAGSEQELRALPDTTPLDGVHPCRACSELGALPRSRPRNTVVLLAGAPCSTRNRRPPTAAVSLRMRARRQPDSTPATPILAMRLSATRRNIGETLQLSVRAVRGRLVIIARLEPIGTALTRPEFRASSSRRAG